VHFGRGAREDEGKSFGRERLGGDRNALQRTLQAILNGKFVLPMLLTIYLSSFARHIDESRLRS
jgi:hypothetical protein